MAKRSQVVIQEQSMSVHVVRGVLQDLGVPAAVASKVITEWDDEDAVGPNLRAAGVSGVQSACCAHVLESVAVIYEDPFPSFDVSKALKRRTAANPPPQPPSPQPPQPPEPPG